MLKNSASGKCATIHNIVPEIQEEMLLSMAGCHQPYIEVRIIWLTCASSCPRFCLLLWTSGIIIKTISSNLTFSSKFLRESLLI